MADSNVKLCLIILILYGLLCYVQGSGICNGQVSEKIYQYAQQHFKRNWQSATVSAKQPNNLCKLFTDVGTSFVYLPHEVILGKNAISQGCQKELFSEFFPSISEIKKKTDQSLCSKNRCVLFSWTMRDKEHAKLQDLGREIFDKAAKKLSAFQDVKPDSSIDSRLQPQTEIPARFSAIHGVWYNENGSLQSHRDKTWTSDEHNKTSNTETEWVLSISLGASALFTYYHPDDKKEKYGTTVIVESGDILLFNGAYLYHGVSIVNTSTPPWLNDIVPGITGRLNLQYRALRNPGILVSLRHVYIPRHVAS